MIRKVKGTRDILPPESQIWAAVEDQARRVFAGFGYHEIRIPILEPTELFVRSVGEGTDIVAKEMYTFDDRKGSFAHDAPGRNGRGRQSVHRKRARPAAAAGAAVLLRPDVPLRENAEGAFPPVFADRDRVVWAHRRRMPMSRCCSPCTPSSQRLVSTTS